MSDKLTAAQLKALYDALDQPKQVRDEDDWLQYVQAKAREISKSPAPRRRVQPKVRRHSSPRQRQAEKMTNNPFKAGMMDAEESTRQWDRISDADEDITTRNVGPGDLNQNYCHGKETGYRGVDYNK